METRIVPKLLAKEYGSIQMLGAHTESDLANFDQYIMSMRKDETRCSEIWGTAVCCQYDARTAIYSESLAEADGPFLAMARRPNTHGLMSMKQMVWRCPNERIVWKASVVNRVPIQCTQYTCSKQRT